MKLHIQNGRVLDPAGKTDRVADVFIADGKILAIGAAPADFCAERSIDASGMVVAPGLVDLAARLREPGYEYKATLESEMLAALHGGVTSLVCPPDTDPVLDEPGLVEMLKYRAGSLNQAHVYPLGALTVGLKGQALTEMALLTEAGCIGFSQAEVPVQDTNVLLGALRYAATYGYTVWLRPQDAYIGRGGVAHSGPYGSRLGLPGVPVIAETIALHTIFELMRTTGAKVHLCRISSAAGLEMVRAAKQAGLPVTCDVGVHHVHLCDHDIGFFDPNARLQPPLRSGRDRDAIRQALQDGTIDVICSDHTPVDDDEKMLPFGEASPGATGLELLLPLALKWGQEAGPAMGQDGIMLALEKITSAAARVAGLPGGSLQVGGAADICVFDPAQTWQVKTANLVSQGKHTPFLGYEMSGRVHTTVVNGRIVWQAAGAEQAVRA